MPEPMNDLAALMLALAFLWACMVVYRVVEETHRVFADMRLD